MGGVLAFDLSPSLCGWAHVEGAAIVADAFDLGGVSEDLGGMARALASQVKALRERFEPAQIAYEAPILLRKDTLLKLRCIYGIGMVLEMCASSWGIPCGEVDLKRIKSLLTGDPYADKKLVVQAVGRMGVLLPVSDAAGRKDAADAVGCGLVTLQALDAAAADVWLGKLDQRLL